MRRLSQTGRRFFLPLCRHYFCFLLTDFHTHSHCFFIWEGLLDCDLWSNPISLLLVSCCEPYLLLIVGCVSLFMASFHYLLGFPSFLLSGGTHSNVDNLVSFILVKCPNHRMLLLHVKLIAVSAAAIRLRISAFGMYCTQNWNWWLFIWRKVKSLYKKALAYTM